MEQRRAPVRRHPAARARQVAGVAGAAAMLGVTGWLASRAGTPTTATQSADAAAATNPSATPPATTAATAAPTTTTTAAAAAKAATPSAKATTRSRGS